MPKVEKMVDEVLFDLSMLINVIKEYKKEYNFWMNKKKRGAKMIRTDAINNTQIPRWCRIDISNGLPWNMCVQNLSQTNYSSNLSPKAKRWK